MRFEKFESVLFLKELLIFEGSTDWLQAIIYKSARDNLNNYLEDSRTDYNSNYDQALDYYEYVNDNLNDSISDRVHDIYLYIEFGKGVVIND